jgi:hypothetical protein
LEGDDIQSLALLVTVFLARRQRTAHYQSAASPQRVILVRHYRKLGKVGQQSCQYDEAMKRFLVQGRHPTASDTPAICGPNQELAEHIPKAK